MKLKVTMPNKEDFLKSLELAEARVPIALLHAQQAIAEVALEEIVLVTPYDLGYLATNWQVTLDAPASTPIGSHSNPVAIDPIPAGMQVIAEAKPFGVIYISNPVEYAWEWELGLFIPPNPGPSRHHHDPSKRGRVLVTGGYNVTALQGMVGPVFEAFQGYEITDAGVFVHA